MFYSKILLLFFLLVLTNCVKNSEKVSLIKETRQDLEMIEAFKSGYDSLNKGDPFFAAKKFLEAELLFPQSEWASEALLMASYSYYLQNYYSEAVQSLSRFLETYPKNKNIAYAHYLLAMCYYETIEDETRDSLPLLNARRKFKFIVENYPETDFALDSKFKIDLIEDILASKEMYIARYYLKRGKWIPSLRRFKIVIEDFDQTIFAEEALHRLVELNYKLGLENEAKKYANILGYNYQSGEWYEKTYKIFNVDYSKKINDEIKKDKKSVIDKFKKLF
jgi:outer membrane protein assembly factor BamD